VEILPAIVVQMIDDTRCLPLHIGGTAEGTWEYARGMRVLGMRHWALGIGPSPNS
jgi:hypothetical protein